MFPERRGTTTQHGVEAVIRQHTHKSLDSFGCIPQEGDGACLHAVEAWRLRGLPRNRDVVVRAAAAAGYSWVWLDPAAAPQPSLPRQQFTTPAMAKATGPCGLVAFGLLTKQHLSGRSVQGATQA